MTTTLILSSGKCAWGKCHACGWGKLEYSVNVDKLKKQVESMNFDSHVKVFTSGSFLDDKQFPKEFRKWFVEHIKSKGVKELTIEALPTFITDETLHDFIGLQLNIGIGLETSNPETLRKYKKPFTVEQFINASDMLHNYGFKVRTYLMVNIPFTENLEGDLKNSVELALKYSDSIVLINTFPHSKSELFDDWISGKWKPLSVNEFNKIVTPYKDNKKIETDAQNYAFRPKFPPEKRVELVGATIENLKHPFFKVWQDYFQRFYDAPKGRDILLFLPCSFKKPYTSSSTHKNIYKAISNHSLFNRIHRVVVSNPGVIPIEFSDHYPFNAYDWPEREETKEVMEAYIETTKERVKKYLEAHKKDYKHVCVYMKYSQTYEAIKQACIELDIECTHMLDLNVWDRIKGEKSPIIKPIALACLRKNLTKM